MEFQEFREELLERVNALLPTGISAIYHQVQKNNNVSLTGILLDMISENGVSAVLYVEQLFECYLQGDTVDAIAEKVRDTLINQKAPWEFSEIYSYEKVRDRIVYRLFGQEQNHDRMDHEPHRKLLDMALSYAVFFDDSKGASGLLSITNELIEDWGVTEEMLYAHAKENTERLMGESFLKLSLFCDEEETERTSNQCVLTNRQRFYGATAMLYSHALREYAERLECNLYIIPTSIHEVVVMPRTPKEYDGLRETLRALHSEVVSEENILTDSIYIYDLAEDTFKVEKVNGIERG